ncbi:DM13 domain-containing protein [Oscillatoria amoena NRMC-F 0135]|nr:DM13 domain-containing protein [Oscillatoria amoena NRMC-F 0135]
MKKLIVLLFVVLLGCDPENNTPSIPIDDEFDPGMATKLKMGSFAGVAGHTVSGMAITYDENGKKVLLLDPFTSQNGPDLRVYLSKDANAGFFINLGRLKSTTGAQSYEIPGNPNLDEYPFVLIWCQQFSVGFGEAEIN